MGLEQIAFEVDPRSVIGAVSQMNRALDSFDGKAEGSPKKIEDAWERASKVLLNFSDKQQRANERLVRSIEQQAAAYGRSGTERLIAQRDQIIKRLGSEESAVKRVTAAYDKMIEATKGASEGGSIGGSAGRTAFLGVKDLFEGRSNYALVEFGKTLSALKGAPLVIGGVTAAIAGTGIAALEAAKHTAEYAHEQEILAAKTGLTTTETQLFSRAAQISGIEIGTLSAHMRTLSRAMADSSDEGKKAKEALKELGLDQSVAFQAPGAALSTIYGRLANVGDSFERERIAATLFGRGGLEALPLAKELQDLQVQIRAVGGVMDEEGIKKSAQYERRLQLLGIQWDALKLKFGEKAIAVIDVILNHGSSASKNLTVFDPWGSQAKVVADLAVEGLGSAGLVPPPPPDLSPEQLQKLFPERFSAKSFVPNGLGILRSQQAEQIRSYLENAAGGGRAGEEFALQRKISSTQLDLQAAIDRNDLAGVKSANQKLILLKQQEQALGKIAEITERVAAAQDRAELRPFGKLGELEEQRRAVERKFDAEVKENPSLAGKIAKDRLLERAAINRQIVEEARKESTDEKIARQQFEQYANTRPLYGTGVADANLKFSLEDQRKFFSAQTEIESIGIEAQREDLRRRAGQAERLAAFSEERDPVAAARLALNARIDLTRQLSAIEQQRIDNEEDANQKAVLTARLLKDTYSDLTAAQEDFNLRLAEIEKRQEESISRLTEGLYHTLLTKPSQFGRQFRDTVHEALVRPAAEGLSNLTARALRPLIYGADGTGGIAGVFRGAFGGKQENPLIAATDTNNVLTRQNNALLDRLNGLLGRQEPGVRGRDSEYEGGAGGSFLGIPFGGVTAALERSGLIKSDEAGIFGDLKRLLRSPEFQPRDERAEELRGLPLHAAAVAGPEVVPAIERAVAAVGKRQAPGSTPPLRSFDTGVSLDTSAIRAAKPSQVPDSVAHAAFNGSGVRSGNTPIVEATDANTSVTRENNGLLARLNALLGRELGVRSQEPGVRSVAVPTGPGGSFLGFPFNSIAAALLPLMATGLAQAAAPGGFAPERVPAGVVSSTIDFGAGAESTGPGAIYGLPAAAEEASPIGSALSIASPIGIPGLTYNGGAFENSPAAGGSFLGLAGTGGFPGLGTGGLPGIGGLLGGFGGLGKLIGYQGGGIWKGIGGTMFGASGSGFGGPLSFGNVAGSIASSPLGGFAGMALATHGLFGPSAGTAAGIAQGTAGGALIGLQYGGPIGAAIGAAAGFGIGLGEKLAGVESPQNEAKRLVKQIYGISIDNKMADQIVSIANSRYAGHVSIAVRAPEVRDMMGLYAAGTGQKIPLSASSPHAGSLVESGGSLFQQATYLYGRGYVQPSSLPVIGGPVTGTWPAAQGPTYLSLNIGSDNVAGFMTGSYVTPELVGSQFAAAMDSSSGRLRNSAVVQQPGLIPS